MKMTDHGGGSKRRKASEGISEGQLNAYLQALQEEADGGGLGEMLPEFDDAPDVPVAASADDLTDGSVDTKRERNAIAQKRYRERNKKKGSTLEQENAALQQRVDELENSLGAQNRNLKTRLQQLEFEHSLSKQEVPLGFGRMVSP
jgi:septin family protein